MLALVVAPVVALVVLVLLQVQVDFGSVSGPRLDDLSKVFDLSSYDLELERLELMERDQIQSTNVY